MVPVSDPHLTKFLELGPAALYDAMEKQGAVDPSIKPIHYDMRLAGPAFTVDCIPLDNLTVHYALAQATPGDVLVIAAGGLTETAVLGDIMALLAKTRGLAGVIVDGAVRDSAEIAAMGLPVFAKATTIRSPTRSKKGALQVPVMFGGISISPGDVVIGGRDGIVVIPKEAAAEAYQTALARAAKEAGIMEQIRAGKTTVEIYNLSST